MEIQERNLKQGFTLLELLVVVLIIGILAAIALPQYQMAVTKAKVASMLPIMRRFKDALMEYKLINGNYCQYPDDCEEGFYDTSVLGVSFPEDWKDCCNDIPCENNAQCQNDNWYCTVNEEKGGAIQCDYKETFSIYMYQPDDSDYEDFRGMIICSADNDNLEGHKICKALGGKLIGGYDSVYKLY